MVGQSATSSFLAHPFQLVSLLDMKPLNYSTLCSMLGLLRYQSQRKSDANLDAEEKEALRMIETYLKEMNLAKSLTLVKRIQGEFEDEKRTESEFADRINVLDERIRDDLEGIVFLYVPEDRVDFYNNPRLFGDQVATKFSKAGFDIEEAGKSFALDRYTACVMHLMRSLEVALDAVGIAAGLPDAIIEANNSWEKLLRKMWDQIQVNDATPPPDWTARRQFIVDVRAHLFSVKDAWRNPSMHLEKKYTEREAERIFRAVKDFMEHLATHLDEAGHFTP
jgi:hypothetical protein